MFLGFSSVSVRGDFRILGEVFCGGGVRRFGVYEIRWEMEDEGYLEFIGGCCAGGIFEGCSLCG